MYLGYYLKRDDDFEIFAFFLDDFFSSSIDFAHVRLLRTYSIIKCQHFTTQRRERERKKNRNDGLTRVLVDGRRHSHHGGGTSRRGGFDPKKYASKSFVFEY